MSRSRGTDRPLRFRMLSGDKLCFRSMEICWRDITGIQYQWSSWADNLQGGCYEAEKFLPSTSSRIRVSFRAHGARETLDVCKVDRSRQSEWVKTETGEYEKETIWFRVEAEQFLEAVDAVFELVGNGRACYVQSAWNSAPNGIIQPDAEWERWCGERPDTEFDIRTLEAADGAAPLLEDLGNPEIYFKSATKRLCAAMKAMIDVHRDTVEGLVNLDGNCTTSWWGRNVGLTASAGLGITAVFVAPPIAVPIGLGAMVTGVGSTVVDQVSDQQRLHAFRRVLATDDANCCALSELVLQWEEARSLRGVAGSRPINEDANAEGEQHQNVFGGILQNVANAQVVGSIGMKLVKEAHVLSTACRVAGQTLNITGTALGVGFMINGWASSGQCQTILRESALHLKRRILGLQNFLAAVDRVECQLCSEEIALIHEVRYCAHSLHCFHESCIREQVARSEDFCSLCGALYDAEACAMVDSLELFEAGKLLAASRAPSPKAKRKTSISSITSQTSAQAL